MSLCLMESGLVPLWIKQAINEVTVHKIGVSVLKTPQICRKIRLYKLTKWAVRDFKELLKEWDGKSNLMSDKGGKGDQLAESSDSLEGDVLRGRFPKMFFCLP